MPNYTNKNTKSQGFQNRKIVELKQYAASPTDKLYMEAKACCLPNTNLKFRDSTGTDCHLLTTDHGVFKTVWKWNAMTKTMVEHLKQVCLLPIVPVSILRDTSQTGNPEIIKFSFFKNGKIHNIAIPEAVVAEPNLNRNAVSDLLSNHGITLSIKDWLEYKMPVLSAINILKETNEIEEHSGSSISGWVDGCDEHITAGDERYCGSEQVFRATEGSVDKWQAAIQRTLEISDGATLALAASVGGLARGIRTKDTRINTDSSNFVHFVGDTSCGKTSIAKVCASILGEPIEDRGFTSWASTRVGIENALTSANHSFFVLDEITQMYANENFKDQEITNTLIKLANGGARKKANRTGGLAKARIWNTTIISTGNDGLRVAENGSQSEAVRVRFIEALDGEHIKFWDTEFADEIDKIKTTLEMNYGHGYLQFTKYISENKKDLIANHTHFFENISKEFKGDGVIKRKAKSWGLIELGIMILEGVGFKVPKKKIVSNLMRIDFETTISRNSHKLEDMMDTVLSVIASNSARFYTKGHAWHGEYSKDSKNQKLAAKEKNKNISNSQRLLGFWNGLKLLENENDTTNVLFGLNRDCKEMLKLRGFNFDTFIRLINEMGCLIKCTSGKTTKNASVDGKQSRFYIIDFGLFQEKIACKNDINDIADDYSDVPF